MAERGLIFDMRFAHKHEHFDRFAPGLENFDNIKSTFIFAVGILD